MICLLSRPKVAAHPQRQVGVGEQLDGLRLRRAGQERGHVLGHGALGEQTGDELAVGSGVADDDP
jgi:hypothetical protein